MKKLVILFALIIGITVTYAQIDEEGGQYFGGTRALSASQPYSQFDFGTVTEPVTHEFVIRNQNPHPLTITEINSPAGVTITIVDKVIKPMQSGKIIVTLDPQYIKKKGEVKLPLIITTVQDLGNGQVISKKSLYLITGVVK